jgi:hypothetical protein
MIDLDELLKFPIRRNHCDKENANPHFINGIETVFEYAEQLPTLSWIPVSERLPEDDTDVLVFCGTTGKFYETAYLCYGKWFACWDGTEIVCVTHWMPLPSTEGLK